MGIESLIQNGVTNTARRIVIYGDPGVGKSTACSELDKNTTIFLDCESGTANIDVRRIRINSYRECIEVLRELYKQKDKLNLKHLVIDGLDALGDMMLLQICKDNNVETIEAVQGGYGKGYIIAAEQLRHLLKIFSSFIDKGVNVILIGHGCLQHIDEPDDLTGKGYDHYTLYMSNGKKAVPIITGWADAVLYMTYEKTFVEVSGKNKAAGNKRVIYTEYSAAHEAKNRYKLPPKMDLTAGIITKICGVNR